MKVLMVSKACVVGAYQRKLEELAARGIELLAIVPPYWQEEARRIPLERLHTRGYRLEVEPIRFNGKFHLFHFPGLARTFREFDPDVVHVDEEPYNVATWHAVRLAKQYGARALFFTWQNLFRPYPPPFRWIERYCFRNVRHAIAGNAEAVEVLRRKGYKGPTTVIPQFGVDPEVFRPVERPEATPAPAQFRVGYVGRLVKQKGILDLLQALAGLGGDWQLTLVGAGPLAPVLGARAAELGVPDRVKMLGGVASSAMPGIIGGFDAVVLPSRTRPNWKEQFGRALVEAMACEVPVVGSDSGEIPNVIGDAGLIFPEGGVASLRHRLVALRDSSELRRDLGRRGRARVLERFTQARVADQTVRVYEEMLRQATCEQQPATRGQ